MKVRLAAAGMIFWAGMAFLSLAAAAVCLAAAPTAPAQFTWQNPLPRGSSGLDGLRDPFILRVDSVWYMTGTPKPFFEQSGDAPGVPLYHSADLKTWQYDGLLIARKPGTWYQDRFWAPEIHVKQTKAGRKFYLTFNCFNKAQKSPQGVGLAVADAVTGPYTLLTPDHPLANGNDADIFTDDDGRDYLFTAWISCQQVDLEHAQVIGPRWACVGPGAPEDWDTGPGISREGPEVIKIKDTYYLFYSSWGRGYEVGYATAKDIHGPWVKYAGNPIYGAQNPGACAHYHKAYTQTPDVPYSEVGHGQPFVGPDGRWWISAHFHLKQQPPETAKIHGYEQPGYDPLLFINGEFKATIPTWTPQTTPLPAEKGSRR